MVIKAIVSGFIASKNGKIGKLICRCHKNFLKINILDCGYPINEIASVWGYEWACNHPHMRLPKDFTSLYFKIGDIVELEWTVILDDPPQYIRKI